MKTRLLSGIVFLLILFSSLFLGKIPFGILMTVCSVLGLKELINIREKDSPIPFGMKIISFISCLFIVFSNFQTTEISYNFNISIFLLFSLISLISIIFYKEDKYNIIKALYIIGITIFIAIVFSNLIIIRNVSLGIITYILLISMTTDTFAYLGGSLIGKTKFNNISPNKTIEGSIIGTFFATIIGSFFYILTIGDIDINTVIIISIILSILSQVGDLTFSAIKRFFKIKDFSNLIRGHGGILDRFDSIIFVTIGYILLNSLI